MHPQSGILGRFHESYSFGRYCYNYIVKNHKNIDLIYANTWPLMSQYFDVKAAKKYHIPIVIHVQDIYPESLLKKLPIAAPFFKNILMPLDKYILRNANHVITISVKMKNYLAKSRKLNNDKISVIPNWQDEAPFINYRQERPVVADKKFTFMYLGNMGPVAGIDVLLKSFAKAHLGNAVLIIAGSGSMKDTLVKDAKNIPECGIEFWDVPDGRVPEIQSKADVLLLPVKKGDASSSIPSKLLAYMFSAKPIIASVDIDSDTAAVINAARCGYTIKSGDLDLLSAVMKQAYSLEKSEMEKMGINGRHYALENFSKKINLKKAESVFKSLLKLEPTN